MTKTRNDVITQALRHIGVVSAGDYADSDMEAYAGGVLDTLFDEFKTVHGATWTWALDATPDAAFLPLSRLLAVEVAPHYNRPAEPRARAVARLRAYSFPDDRPDRADFDGDGTVDAGEAEADARAQFY